MIISVEGDKNMNGTIKTKNKNKSILNKLLQRKYLSADTLK